VSRPILVLGSAGQVGTELMRRQGQATGPIVGFDRDTVDICDAAEMRALVTSVAPDLVINAAAYTAVDKAESERLERHVILRTACVFSAHGGNFLKTILRRSAERPELRVVDDQTGGPTPAAVIAEVLLAIANMIASGSTARGTFHYCGAPITTWCRFARAIVDSAARRRAETVPVQAIATADYPTAARRPANSALDCSKIAATFGLAQPDWSGGVTACVSALLAQDAAG
jgi:dTDP-4-dehydrorhamnose reductase